MARSGIQGSEGRRLLRKLDEEASERQEVTLQPTELGEDAPLADRLTKDGQRFATLEAQIRSLARRFETQHEALAYLLRRIDGYDKLVSDSQEGAHQAVSKVSVTEERLDELAETLRWVVPVAISALVLLLVIVVGALVVFGYLLAQ